MEFNHKEIELNSRSYGEWCRQKKSVGGICHDTLLMRRKQIPIHLRRNIYARRRSETPFTDYYNCMKAMGLTSEEMHEMGREIYFNASNFYFVHEMKQREPLYDIDEVGEAILQLKS